MLSQKNHDRTAIKSNKTGQAIKLDRCHKKIT